jgi:hypothetical protein
VLLVGGHQQAQPLQGQLPALAPDGDVGARRGDDVQAQRELQIPGGGGAPAGVAGSQGRGEELHQDLHPGAGQVQAGAAARGLGQQGADLRGTGTAPVGGGLGGVAQTRLLGAVVAHRLGRSGARVLGDGAAVGVGLPPAGGRGDTLVHPPLQVERRVEGVRGGGEGVGAVRVGLLEPGGQAQQ